MLMRILEPRLAPIEEIGVDGIAVRDERVLSVLPLALVRELMRAALEASFSFIVAWPSSGSLWPCQSRECPLIVAHSCPGRH